MFDYQALLPQFAPLNSQQVQAVLQSSPYLQEQLTRHPEWIESLVTSQVYADGELYQRIQSELADIADETLLLKQVRWIRHCETVRIAWRDLMNLAPLAETMRDCSDLADALVEASLTWWYKDFCAKHGVPRSKEGEAQHLVVLGMGKLGGQELNFSSDIDLIFAFPEAGMTDGRRELDNQTFFVRLGQKLINTLGAITADGFAYRVDMRLRPFGDAGALALSFDAMEHYYQTHGREWERYAMIKARVMAGDKTQGAELMQRLRPFIYRRYLDYGAVEQLRDMKAMINREAERKGKAQDVKLGRGGIREVEFIAQVFQLMRGGRERELQLRSLLPTLACLKQLDLLSQEDEQALQDAYCFLRRVENHLQMWKDEQTHALPNDPTQCELLAQSLGFNDWDSFLAVLNNKREIVHALFRRVFAMDESKNPPMDDKGANNTLELWSGRLSTTKSAKLLSDLGYKDIDIIQQVLSDLHEGRLYQTLTELARTRLDRLMPHLIVIAAQQTDPDSALCRSITIIQAIARRSVYMSMLSDHPEALAQLVKLVSHSIWLTTQLAQYPILLDELLDAQTLYRPLDRTELYKALHYMMARVDEEDTERVMEQLRQFKNTQILRVAAADISKALPVMKVSDQLTWIAEVILEFTWQNVWNTLSAKSGIPTYQVNNETKQAGFAIIGYGKLGGIELGYGSDLDIVFLHDSEGEKQTTNGDKPLDNGVFYTRLSQKIINLLSTFTHDGRLYETDTRLRPSGASGLLVSSIEAFRKYQFEKAWLWEHQALLRARALTGSNTICEQFEQIRREVLCQKRDPEVVKQEVSAMRQKMWENFSSKYSNTFDIKKDPGGITDIEFIVQGLILMHAATCPKLVEWSDNVRQLESLQQCGILPPEEATQLADIYRAMRSCIHTRNLQAQDTKVPSEWFKQEREFVQATWRHYFS
ncbi:bifunctional [glutamate--ammonia ligase]-adenylyl-L-tyrosine phosphorylase/[glutamate--ammonia-ligase] adenylyltransferase [Thiofilum flexile]|uniref:bifunctional [glutamate--ammonia ligase]-adenylyl-L-tyrosine phosphorylase/[glutamate--ammonia-ligase] adenylyltransferase n=1 Tax=Thiofilum flexile TaxID=125627 RepID=UPI0003731EEF|nr:bifunctional [glutamate--ammonia ligase]-adenylyl-L-tyrosine phosphorylase/[glutamate--ammonia-ligase] adenylyltransferase [Thiofilum flexile]